MTKPHKHTKYVQAFIEGKTVEYKLPCDRSEWWSEVTKFEDFDCYDTYRIEPPEKVVRWQWACHAYDRWVIHDCLMSEKEANVALAGFCYIKLDWTRMEFDK